MKRRSANEPAPRARRRKIGRAGGRERLKQTLDVPSDPDLMRQIRASERYFARGGRGLSFKEVFGEPLRRVKPKKRARSRIRAK